MVGLGDYGRYLESGLSLEENVRSLDKTWSSTY